MTDDEVRASLKTYAIGLTVEEAKKVEEMLGRPPTVVEAVIWGIQGSEHSSYKSSRRFLKNFPTTGKHVILGPKEDSGIVALTDDPEGKRWGIVISHESHNHPSQIVPFEGAATGVGGTVRDVACMGARVVGCMDLLRLGDLKSAESRGIAKEVIRGIAGYGNPLGIPNLGGDTVFDEGYNNNCLVNAIAVGIVREDEIIHSYVPKEAAEVGYDIILIGKPTDRSGFGGAAFSSLVIEEEKREQNTGAVQEPNPFLERHLLVSTNALFDWLAETNNLHRVSFKDLGAGGVVCATVEQVAPLGYGAEIDLDALHVALPDLPPEVLACAETQERFCWMCHPDLTQHILRHYNETWDLPSVAENARASVIGRVTASSLYVIRHKGVVVCSAKSDDITSGLLYNRPTKLSEQVRKNPLTECEGQDIVVTAGARQSQTNLRAVLDAMLAHPNHASKARAFRHFDKTVIGSTVVEAGEADASVIAPLRDVQSLLPGGRHPGWDLPEEQKLVGAAFAGDGNPRYGRVSAYGQGYLAAIESMYNVAAVGATPRALTDCLNYGNPEIPEQLAALEQGVQGIAAAAKGVTFDGEGVPVISGNVSLYNGLADGSAIPPSAIVCCIGVLPDANKAVTMRLQRPDSVLLLIGERKNECGGSAYYEVLQRMFDGKTDDYLGSSLPSPDPKTCSTELRLAIEGIRAGSILSCHDISDGGLLLALVEMTFPQRKRGGNIGVSVDIGVLGDLPSDCLLFSQTPGFIAEIRADALETVLSRAQELGAYAVAIGKTRDIAELQVARAGNLLLEAPLRELHAVWTSSLEEVLDRSEPPVSP